MAKVSVIVPAYNVEMYLCECIESILGQNYFNIEIILVDDGSTDNTAVLCDLYASKDNRIKVIHKTNGGLSSARLAGFQASVGDLICFVDSDDWLAPKMIEKAVLKITQRAADVCIFGHFTVAASCTIEHLVQFDHVDTNTEIIEKILIPMAGADKNARVSYVPGFICHKMYRRDIIKFSYFVSERDYFAEDVIFNLHIFSNAQRVAVIKEGLYFYRRNEDSLSNGYRMGVWDKLERLYVYMVNFYKMKGLLPSVQKRLNDALFKFLIFSIDNECKKRNISPQYKKISVIREILKSHLVAPWLARYDNKQNPSPTHIFYYYMIKHRLALPLFLCATLKNLKYGR